MLHTLEVLTDADRQACETVHLSKQETVVDTSAVAQRRLYIESYGCQMNFADSEIVTAIMRQQGFATTAAPEQADVIFLNTCAIRDNAEQKVRHRLHHLQFLKKQNPGLLIGVLGCMAERLKTKLLDEEKMVDLVAGPDAYRDLPRLVGVADAGQQAINVLLSREETYADITPVRLGTNGVSAFISIMRGCNNMCSFCVVPFTRGRERSRDPHSIVAEARALFEQGYREVTLLGQNVDSYRWTGNEDALTVNQLHNVDLPGGQSTDCTVVTFADLLGRVAGVSPQLRVRFSTSHPKDITDEVLHAMRRHDNVCNYIHLPVQSGNSRVLALMNRTYDRDWYLERVAAIRRIVGEDCGLSSDMIAGFCSENEAEHQDTLSLMEAVQYDYAYMFAYSERPGTPAAKKLSDDVPDDVKRRRLTEIIALQTQHAHRRNQRAVGQIHTVLVEGFSKRSDQHLSGRNDQNKVVVFPKKQYQKGQYVRVRVTQCTAATLLGEAVD